MTCKVKKLELGISTNNMIIKQMLKGRLWVFTFHSYTLWKKVIYIYKIQIKTKKQLVLVCSKF